MAVLIEAISVVVRTDAVLAKFSGGWEAFKAQVPNRTLCADKELARVGFLEPADMAEFVAALERGGLVHVADGQAVDFVVADQRQGLSAPCAWANFGHMHFGGDPAKRIAACRFAGSTNTQLVAPPGWTYEDSLSRNAADAGAAGSGATAANKH